MTNKVRCARCRKWGITTIHKKLAWGLCPDCRKEPKKQRKLVWR